ncbi:MAG: DNA repair protein RecO [Ginsengibacter sp.]
MIYQTKGIVLRTIKFGETSVVANIFTALFGIQSYIINGVRTSGKSSSKAALFQPTSILDMEVYNNELKDLQRIKEFRWSYLYKNILSDVTKNSVAVYMVELLQKCLKQPENNIALFQFTEDAFIQLDTASEPVAANFPLYFSLHLIHFFGFSISDNYSKVRPIFDMQEGIFVSAAPSHQYYLEGTDSYNISQILKVRHPADLSEIKLNKATRREILLAMQTFYGLHIQEFGAMKTLPILQEILS